MGKRKTNYNSKKSIKKAKSDLPKQVEPEEPQKSILGDVDNNNNIEIIDLNNTDIEMETEDENEDNDDWEDVSDYNEVIEIYLGDAKQSKCDVDEQKREKRKLEREHQERLHRTMLMALIARLKWIDGILEEDLMRHLAYSIIPVELLSRVQIDLTGAELKEVVQKTVSVLRIVQGGSGEAGDVRETVRTVLASRRVNEQWANVVAALLLRVVGIQTRLVAVLYPCSLKQPESSAGILCQPTQYRASTRGSRKKKTDNQAPSRVSKLMLSPERPGDVQQQRLRFSVEVLLPSLLHWVCVDVNDFSGTWDNLEKLAASRPRFLYVVASSPPPARLRCLAARYDPMWALSSSRNQRLPASSLARFLFGSSLNHNLEAATDEDAVEDARTRQLLLGRPLPLTLADYRGHPLYVLEDCLLKYEVLHPPGVAAISNFRGKKVYLREHVRLAHTAETWLKEAMVVKPEEHEPCKRVPTMASRHKAKRVPGRDPLVDLWGPWQVQPYDPPIARDGEVPINKYGNVDLFQPTMLPIGCAHLLLPGVHKVANRLGLSCAPAMVGWAFTKNNMARPLLEGSVVCSEHVEVLTLAWREQHQQQMQDQLVVRQKRVWARWRVLLRRLLLRERLRRDYNL